MRSLTTSARVHHARAALRQAATLLRDAANLGTMSHDTRRLFVAAALSIETEALGTMMLETRANRDLDTVRARKRRRSA